MSITATLSVTSFFRHQDVKFKARKLSRRGGPLRVRERSLLNLVCDFDRSDSVEDNDCDEIKVGCSAVTDVCCNTPSLWKINNTDTVSMSMRGSRDETDDVDQLVELINLNSLRNQSSHAANPKKAAKKARQKARKEEEKRLKIEAENALREAEEKKRLAEERKRLAEERRRLAEEQLERQMRNLNLSKKSGKNVSSKQFSQMKENKNVSQAQDIRGVDAKNGGKNYKGSNKGSAASLPDGKARGLSISNQGNNVCAKHCCLETEPVAHATVPLSTGKKSKKKKKKEAEIEQPRIEYCSHTCSSHPSCGVPPASVVQPVDEEPEDDPNSAKSKKARKKARQQLRRAQLASNNHTSGVDETKQMQAVQTCNYGHPVVINVPNPPFSMASSKLDAPTTLKVGKSHLDWNSFSGEASASSTKPEMVTIRRHPTVSDTTVTISIKNQNGDEDVLYTLLNGQVVRSKPDAVDIDSFIADPADKEKPIQKRSSKKKRNKKKSSVKDVVAGGSQPLKIPEVVEMAKAGSRDRDIVTCTPVLNPCSGGESVLLQQGPRLSATEAVKPRSSYSLFNELDDGAEIDLTKLKLPPGITITKVNQPVSSFAGLGQVDEDKHSNANVETSYANPNPTVMPSTGQTANGANASTPSLYYSDGFHSKPNVIVVDSQEYNGDNESDADDFVGFKKRPNKFEEVVSVKVKRLRNRVNRYLYGDDPSSAADRQENIPEKILTPAQASVYLNQHIPANRVKHQGPDLNGEACPRNSNSLRESGSGSSYSDAHLIPTSTTINRSASCGSKRKQPLGSSAMRTNRPKEFFQPQPIGPPVFTAGLNFSNNPFGQNQSVETNAASNPFTANYHHVNFSSQSSFASSSNTVHEQTANTSVPLPKQMNGYDSWAPPVRPSLPSTNSAFSAHREFVNQPFFFRSNDSH